MHRAIAASRRHGAAATLSGIAALVTVLVLGPAHRAGQVLAAASNSATPNGDFDGDGRADIAFFRPGGTPPSTPASWHIVDRVGGIVGFGGAGDFPVPADYDGDGSIDIAIFRPSTSEWHVWQSGSLTFVTYIWGSSGDMLVPADYDGDGRADPAVFTPSTGGWDILQSQTMTPISYTFGAYGDIPVPRDYDGDGKTDIAVRRLGGFDPPTWYVWQSRTQTGRSFNFSVASRAGIPVPADYDGDGQADLAAFYNGQWDIRYSTTQITSSYIFGHGADTPVPADYDGDGKTDLALYRPGSPSVWYIWQSGTQTGLAVEWGETGDIPITSLCIDGQPGRQCSHRFPTP